MELTKICEKEYHNMREKYDIGYITEEEWFQYCESVLVVIMEENSDSLKDRE